MSPSPKKTKRTATPAQRAFLAWRRELTRRRKWLWKHKRPLMEACRAEATKEAAIAKADIAEKIMKRVTSWPDRMTPTQLDEYLLTLPYVRKGKVRRMPRASLIRRLRSYGLISYDPASNVWTNLCTLPPSKPSAPSEANDQGTTERPDRSGG
jgi:hypothetical protein